MWCGRQFICAFEKAKSKEQNINFLWCGALFDLRRCERTVQAGSAKIKSSQDAVCIIITF